MRPLVLTAVVVATAATGAGAAQTADEPPPGQERTAEARTDSLLKEAAAFPPVLALITSPAPHSALDAALPAGRGERAGAPTGGGTTGVTGPYRHRPD